MSRVLPKNFRFVDLFAGIGGFHQAMANLGGKCKYAIEINPETAFTYMNNYPEVKNVLGDITQIDLKDVPDHDVLCAGFPCQPFSKAGKQKGFDDYRGTLFFQITKILEDQLSRKYGGPRFIILENVRNLLSHNHHQTWSKMKEKLISIGYNVIEQPIVVSPHDYGIPQLRDRAIILAVRKDYFKQPITLDIPRKKRNSLSIKSILTSTNNEYDLNNYSITNYEESVLKIWDEFIHGIDRKTIGFPIWSEWFDLKKEVPLPCPKWKLDFIEKNRELYKKNKSFIDQWLKNHNHLKDIKVTDRKFEWQVQEKIKSVFDGIIQFRPSGVRVKQPTEFPALVAMVHVPIIGKQKRYITPREAANLQSFPITFKIPKNDRLAYKQFGNAVNIKVIENVFKEFIKYIEKEKGVKK